MTDSQRAGNEPHVWHGAAADYADNRRSDRQTIARRRVGVRTSDLPLEDKSSLISPVVVHGLVRLAEFTMVVALGFGIYLFYVAPEETMPLRYLSGSAAIAVLTTLAFQVAGLYRLQAYGRPVNQTARIMAAWTAVFGVAVAGTFFAKMGEDFSRVWFASLFVLGLAALVAMRICLSIAVIRWARLGRLNRRAVVVGGGEAGARLIEALESSAESDILICGVFDDRGDARVSPVVAGYRKLGNYDDLVAFGRRTRVDLLIVSLPITAESRLLDILKKLWVMPVDIRLSAHTNKLRFRPRAYSYIGNVPFIDVLDRPIADWDYVLKWLFDKVVGAAILLFALPVMAAVALAIKLDSRGPVFFRQNRYGFNNELIGVFKFRSMYTDMSDASASKLVTKDDPRVTRVGRFIRKTSLDELPQLINVLRGELSLVGPRPHATQAKAAERLYQDVVDGYFARHKVKPGITGWAQINGWRGETDTREKIQHRVEHDLYYIENWSVLLDAYILMRTPFSLIGDKNAY